MFRVKQRVVISTDILIDALSPEEAKELASSFITDVITTAVSEESGGTDRVTITDIENVDISPQKG